MSDEPTNTPQPESAPNPQSIPSAPPPLRREAVYVVTDPRKFMGVAAITALAGVAIGFALALLAQPPHQCHHELDRVRVVERANVQVTPVPPVHSQEWKLTWLGVQVQSNGQNAVVVDVFDDTPAAEAGLKPGDVIENLGTSPIHSAGDLVRAVRLRDPGDTVTLDVSRDGEDREIEATLTSIRPEQIPR